MYHGSVVFRSSTELEYWAITDTTCEFNWIWLHGELGFKQVQRIRLYCDNQAAIYIANNLVFHERTTLIQVACHIVQYHKMEMERTETRHVGTGNPLVDLFTKPHRRHRVEFISSKLGIYNKHALSWGGVLKGLLCKTPVVRT